MITEDYVYDYFYCQNATWGRPTLADNLLMRDPLPERAAPRYRKDKDKTVLLSNQNNFARITDGNEYEVNIETRDIFDYLIPEDDFEKNAAAAVKAYFDLRQQTMLNYIKRGLLYGWRKDIWLANKNMNEFSEFILDFCKSNRIPRSPWNLLTNKPIEQFIEKVVGPKSNGIIHLNTAVALKPIIDPALGRNIAFIFPPSEYLGVIAYRTEPSVALKKEKDAYMARFYAKYGCGIHDTLFLRKTLVIVDDLLNKYC